MEPIRVRIRQKLADGSVTETHLEIPDYPELSCSIGIAVHFAIVAHAEAARKRAEVKR